VGCIEVPREEAKAFGVMAIDDAPHHRLRREARRPAADAGQPGACRWRAWASTCSRPTTCTACSRTTRSNPDSSHDFGKDLIPRAVAEHQAFAHPFTLSAIATPPFSGPYWRDVGTVDAYWAANLDLASTTPALNMYDKDWPIWTYQEQLPPAKFVHDLDGRRGEAINALVSGGCIVSGSTVRESVLFSNVLVRSYSTIEQAVVLPDVQINRHCRLKKVVIDRRCVIPEGTGDRRGRRGDARRFHRTEGGVVLVTRENARPTLTPETRLQTMRILQVCAEIFPLLKTGGLADVAGALPPALRALGARRACCCPASGILAGLEAPRRVARLQAARRDGAARRGCCTAGCPRCGVDAYVIDAPAWYRATAAPTPTPPSSPTPTTTCASPCSAGPRPSWPQGSTRTGSPTWCTPRLARRPGPAYLQAAAERAGGALPGCVFTVHNLAYQGMFDAPCFDELGLPAHSSRSTASSSTASSTS
jgi:hypothetical protein